jgi:DNA uptake protein ComE-like DNA-binding protein
MTAPPQRPPPPSSPRTSSRLAWSASQSSVLIGLLLLILIYLIARLIMNPVYVSDPQPRVPARADELADKIDPNTADWQTLAALPIIGEKRARDIVAYRERFVAENPGKTAFTRPEDLYRIRGIGDAMLSQIQPYLTFPATTTQPTTRAANEMN